MTIRDVAEKAGVSAMAVSAVLNGAGGRIRKAARELRDQPNHVARTFRRGRTDQVAVVFQNFGHFRLHSSYRGAARRADLPEPDVLILDRDHGVLAGFDSSPLCDTIHFRLTSVAQPVERMAFEATTHLLALIRADEEGASPSSATSTLDDGALDVRESTVPPALTEESSHESNESLHPHRAPRRDRHHRDPRRHPLPRVRPG